MYILVINCGSSSIKFTLFGLKDVTAVANGMVDRIGQPGATISLIKNGKTNYHQPIEADHITDAIELIEELLRHPDRGGIDTQQITAVGHRVVHGGESMNQPVLVDERVKAVIRSCADLAPLHNPPNLEGITALERIFPDARHVAVFDTAFHATLPKVAFIYALPIDLYRTGKIRKYGFHGTSHQFVSRLAAKRLGRSADKLRMVTCHLGNGCSVTAVSGGKSVDTSMGFTPLEGVVMGTRSGDLDPAIVFHLMRRHAMTSDDVETMLNRESGLKGLAGIGSSDMRDLESAAAEGNEQAETAIWTYAYRIRKYIGAYAFAMGGLDAVVFTGGIGENSAEVRRRICEGLEGVGIRLDLERNRSAAEHDGEIHDAASRVCILVVPTNEELEIARQTVEVVEGDKA